MPPDDTQTLESAVTTDETQQTTQQSGQQTPPQQTPPQDDDLRSAIRDLTKVVSTKNEPAKPEKTFTQEEIDEYWGIYNPEKTRKDFMQKFFKLNPDATPEEIQDAKDLWKDMQTGLVKQAVKGSLNLTSKELEKLREEMAPIREYVSQAKAKEIKSRFDTAYPALADAKFSKVLDAHARLLADREFKDENEYFKALAESAAETIKGVDASFSLSAPQKTKPAGTTPRLPRSSVGGTGGAGSGAAAPVSTPKDDIDSLM